MFHRNWQGMLRAFLVLALAAVMAAKALPQNAGKPIVEKAPTPAAMQTAKRVFLGNGGVDGNSIQAFRQSGDMNRAYNLLYAAVKNWGRYELVGNPADADLVFEISFAAPLVGSEKMLWPAPFLRLEILDAKSHFLLWTIVEPVQGANRQSTWESNLNTGVTNVVSELKNVAGGTAVASR